MREDLGGGNGCNRGFWRGQVRNVRFLRKWIWYLRERSKKRLIGRPNLVHHGRVGTMQGHTPDRAESEKIQIRNQEKWS